MWYWECDVGDVIIGMWWQAWSRTFVSTTQYVYNSPPTHSIEQPSIHQPNSTDVVITMPGALGRWSHSDIAKTTGIWPWVAVECSRGLDDSRNYLNKGLDSLSYLRKCSARKYSGSVGSIAKASCAWIIKKAW